MFGEGDSRGPAGRLRLPPQPGLQLPPLPRRHLHLSVADSPLRAPHRGSWRARSARPRRTNATALLRVEAINYFEPDLLAAKVVFDDSPLHPDKRLKLEADPSVPTRA